MEPLIAVQMTNKDAELFVQFQKHKKLIELMDSVDAFSVKGGHVTIHFNNAGFVGSVDVHKRYTLIH